MTMVKSSTNINSYSYISLLFEISSSDVPKALHEEVYAFVDIEYPALFSRERLFSFNW